MREKGVAPSEGRLRRLRLAVSAALACACGLGAWEALTGGVSYAWNLKGEIERTRMNWDEAALDYAKSIRWDGGNAQPHLGLGHLKSTQAVWLRAPDPVAERAEKSRLAAEATGHYRRAMQLNPCDMSAVLGLARGVVVFLQGPRKHGSAIGTRHGFFAFESLQVASNGRK